MDLFITRRGGSGGGSLNFSVVGGTTQPANPEENTIWINTDMDITRWSLSAEEPETPIDGMVWIETGFDNVLGFNAVKENTLMVYPQNASQYVSGDWVGTESEIYQNGEWNMLYDRPARIEKLNATGWARYSEGVSGEYARIYRNGERGFTRNSALPAIWCYHSSGTYIGICLMAATTGALAIGSLQSYSSMDTSSATTPNGNTVYYLYMKYALTVSEGASYTVTSNGATYTLSEPDSDKKIVGNVIGDILGAWADELLFGEV